MMKAKWISRRTVSGSGDGRGPIAIGSGAGGRHLSLALASMLLGGCASQQTNDAVQGTAEVTRAVLQLLTL